MSSVESYVVDTSVLAEYLDEASPLAKPIEKLFEKAIKGEIALYTTTLVIAELLYVASRIYREAKEEEPNVKAKEYLLWLQHQLNLNIVDLDHQLAIETSEARKQLRLALTDCSILALARKLKAKPLFLKIEAEMKTIINTLKEKYNVKFITEAHA